MLVESSGYYWRAKSGPLRNRHRPTVKYNVNNIIRKNKFLLTKDVNIEINSVTQEYDACMTIARYYRAYKIKKNVKELAMMKRKIDSFAQEINSNKTISMI